MYIYIYIYIWYIYIYTIYIYIYIYYIYYNICYFYLGNMINSETYNARNAGMKQEVLVFKSVFAKSLDSLNFDINDRFNNIND